METQIKFTPTRGPLLVRKSWRDKHQADRQCWGFLFEVSWSCVVRREAEGAAWHGTYQRHRLYQELYGVCCTPSQPCVHLYSQCTCIPMGWINKFYIHWLKYASYSELDNLSLSFLNLSQFSFFDPYCM